MRPIASALVALCLLASSIGASHAATTKDGAGAQALVDQAAEVVSAFKADEHYDDMADYLNRAKAVFVVPRLLSAAFIVGGEGGEGVVIARAPDGGWSGPAFYTIAGGSIGFQAGAEAKDLLITVMTDKGLRELTSDQIQVGADASISVGTVGGGVGAGTVGSTEPDFIVFSRSKGLFGGGAIEGSLIRPEPDRNNAYYGSQVSPTDILINRTAHGQGAANLHAALSAR